MLATEQLHTITLPQFVSRPPSPSEDLPPAAIAQAWVDKFSAVIADDNNVSSVASLFHPISWWRDAIALSWDLRTIRGADKIVDFLQQRMKHVQLSDITLASTGRFVPSYKTPVEGLTWIESMFAFETRLGRGRGVLRLAQAEDGVWKAYMMYTALEELKGHEEMAGVHRPHGGNNSLEGGTVKGNWKDRRERQKEFMDGEPTVVIIGAGQSGLNVGARLQALGISCLLIDRNPRVGDNWRFRYRTLVTHDPVRLTHMAFMPFPSNWPLFTPKDKLGDWFEAYASLMELNVWTSTTIVPESTSYDDASHTWSMIVSRNDGPHGGSRRTLRPRHVIFSTGHSGEPKIPSFPGQSTFKGIVYHGSEHQDASVNADNASLAGKRVVVVGTGNSGHDIAQNYRENGCEDVTMLQRSSTYVISAGKGLDMMHKGIYDETGPNTEDADIYTQSLPLPVQFALNVRLTDAVKEADVEVLTGLEAAGFKLDYGIEGSGLARKYLTRGGGYYIDVGASKLIADGSIKMAQSPDGIQGFESEALVLADGRKLPADIVVLATGYDSMNGAVAKALGEETANRTKAVWNLDEEGEMNTMWRPSGHPGLWFMAGNLALCRVYSRFLAMQIKAIEEGLNDPVVQT